MTVKTQSRGCADVLLRGAHQYPHANPQLVSAEYCSTALDRNRIGAHTQGDRTLSIRKAWKYSCALTTSPSENHRATSPSSQPRMTISASSAAVVADAGIATLSILGRFVEAIDDEGSDRRTRGLEFQSEL